MANPEQVEILKQGIEVWNRWKKYQNKQIDLMYVNLTEADLAGADLSATNLVEAKLIGTNLDGVNLNGSSLHGADLRGANLSNATMYFADLSGDGRDLGDVNLNGANLKRIHLHSTNMTRARLKNAILIDAWLNEANFYLADLSDCFLNNVHLSYTDFTFANLTNADLSGAELESVFLSNTKLNGVDLSTVRIGHCSFNAVDLSTVKGLETLDHYAPSTIGIDTFYLSKGNIPEIFLRKAGVPDTFIEYAHSLINNPIDYYTCFISHSSKDQSFAERLYTDLQGKGVRCWYAPEDLKIGDKFWHRIDEPIRLHDKLLVVLSENSIASPWVENEVMAALEKERKQNKTVLFPIKLDDFVMETSLPWAASMRRARHMGDFRKWKSHDDYQKAFDRLLLDLKAGE